MSQTASGNGVLDLLLRQDVSQQVFADDERIIYEYRPASEAGKLILDSFLSFYDKKAKSFPLDDRNNRQKFGVITDIMALSTLLELKSLDVDMSSCEDIYYGLIEKVFADVYRGANVVFDATPYWEEESYSITTYVETASKLISTIIDLRDDILERLYKRKTKMPLPVNIRGRSVSDFGELLDLVEQLIVDAATVLNDAALPVAEPFPYTIDGKKTGRPGVGSSVICRGWAFQKPRPENAAEYETSLYYTYYGTNAFISVYNSMEDFYEYLDTGIELFSDREDKNLLADEKRRKFKYEYDRKFFRANEQVLTRMRELTASAGRYIDTQFKKNGVNIAFDYVDKELRPVSLDAVEKGKNNHVMNSLFAFATLINAGVDDDYASIGKSGIFQNIQFALTNIKKVYLAFREDQREDLIESYSLGEDKCPAEVNMVMQRWRKSGTISTYDLVPLYCNTYNLVSNYVIRYPQKEMRDNLVWVLENKSADGWYWTKESFSINNNLYYIYAIDSFYSYYDRYEATFLAADTLKRSLDSKERKIINIKDGYERNIQEIKAEHKAELEKAKSERSPLDREAENFIIDVMKKNFSALFEETFGNYVEKGFEFAFHAVDGGITALDELRKQLYSDKELQLIFTASSLELLGSGRGMNVSDVETGQKRERLRRALYEQILGKLCHD